jgi:hypothetical protein
MYKANSNKTINIEQTSNRDEKGDKTFLKIGVVGTFLPSLCEMRRHKF